MSEKEKLNIKQTFLIGLGFFAVSISWSVYNAYVPLIIAEYLTSTLLVGLVMTIDNIFGVIFQPLFGRLSDKCTSPLGRRMPFIIIGAPVAALLFSVIPYAKSLWFLMLTVILFNFVMSAWRSPVVALMPDLTPPALRSQGNGIINLWGGIGSVFAFLIGGILSNNFGRPGPFVFSGIVMAIAALLLFLTIKERAIINDMERAHRMAAEDEARAEAKAAAQAPKRKLTKGEKTSLILILVAIFLWFCGFNVVETFFTSFAKANYPGISEGDAGMLLTFYSLAFLLMAVPAGYIAAKIGRRRAILIGLLIDIIVFVALYFVSRYSTSLWLLRGLLILGGLFWAFVNINSLPMVVELAGRDMVGTYTGYYYAFSQTAAIASPLLFGLLHDLTKDYKLMFLYSAVSFVLAGACIFFVKHGEAKKSVEA